MAAPRAAQRVLDAIVVGAGGAHGSATLYHLARRGAKVLGLEAQPAAPHNQGSSHGLSRIIRTAYFEHPSYVPLLRESFRLWRELEAESGEHLLTITGCLNAAPATGARGGDGIDCFNGALLAAREHGLPHEVLSAEQVNRRFPALRLPPGFKGLLEPEAGFLHPEGCIAAHLRLAQQRGAELLCGSRVAGWRVLPGGGEGGEGLVQVNTEGGGSYTAKRLVLAGGGWMPQLVPELQPLLTVERQVVGWFGIAPERRRHFAPDQLPVGIIQDERSYFYTFPGDDFGFKVGAYNHLREKTTADTVDRRITAADEAELRRCAAAYFPGADGPLTKAAACTFTNTPDQNFILDVHPRHPQVVLASACSGHGFKFAPAVGAVLADFALEGGTRHDISLHRLSAARQGHAAVLDAFQRGA